jgi:hypothetical protein
VYPPRCARARRSALILALIACCLVAPFLAPAAPAHAAGTIDGDANASGANDGSSWAAASTTLYAALAAAGSGANIRVAAGTSTPGPPRTATVQLVGGVAISGGYPTGGGTRDWAANPTILSGDIGTTDDNSDTADHVVTSNNNDTPVVRDGITITPPAPPAVRARCACTGLAGTPHP